MNATPIQPKLENFLRYFSAYAWYVFFILFGLIITWGLRSDILLLCMVFSVPQWITRIIETWGIFVMLIPFILMVAGLESYMNDAAKKNRVRQRALKVLAIEAVVGLVVLVVMGLLALTGYPPYGIV